MKRVSAYFVLGCVLVALPVMLKPWSVGAQDEETVIAVTAIAETADSRGDGATSVVMWIHPDDAARSVIITGDDNAGIGVYDLSGAEIQFLEVGEIGYVDLRYNFMLNGTPTTLVAAGIKDTPQIAFFTIEAENRQLNPLGSVEVGMDVNGLCMYHSPRNAEFFVIATSEDGIIEQWQVRDDGNGNINGILARRLSVGTETDACVADDELMRLYISEKEVTLWSYGAEPEDGDSRRIVDLIGRGISEEVEGLALYYAGNQTGYLIASDEKRNVFRIYERQERNAFVGEFAIAEGETIDSVEDSNGIAVMGLPLGEAFPDGVFIASDDENPDGNTNYKLVRWGDIANALNLTVDTVYNPRTVDNSLTITPQVAAAIETEPVAAGIDAADDPAIWIHPTDANLSTVIATDKTVAGGLVVYDLSGIRIQSVPIGRVNNTDLRYNFPLAGEQVALVVGSNRSDNNIVIYKVNPETRELEDVAARSIVSATQEVYGICMYRSPITGKYYAIVNSANTGDVEQWELFDAGNGKVDAQLVRAFSVGEQTEGCAADDELAYLYIGEEGGGFWKYGAEPDDTTPPVLVDTTEEGGHLTADVEGIAIYYNSDYTGYIVVSSQGSSEFVVYTREGNNAYVGSFQVKATDAVDAVSGTDGIDLTNFPLGDVFPEGVFVAQDDLNLSPNDNQNFKLVSWGEIARALNLRIDTSWDPRAVGRE